MANNNLLEEKDYQIAIELLGRKPRTPFYIKSRCPNGNPQTLVADPVFFEDNLWKPFPSFIWLVCPRLKALTADLEQQGLVKFYSNKLKTDDKFCEEFLNGQKEIANYRLNLAQKIFKEELPEHIFRILKETTVAGSHNFYGVKCLHAHLAHYLAFGNNPIGKEIFEKIGECPNLDYCGKKPTGGQE